MPFEFIARNGVIARNNSEITGSLKVTAGVTGSLLGTASFATTASYSATASFVIGGVGSTITIADEGTSQGTATFLNFTGNAVTATVTSNTASLSIATGSTVSTVAGTANQVNINGGTTAVVGAVTVSLPSTVNLGAASSFTATGLTGSLTASSLQGAILNTQLQNSSVTVGTTAISLGGSATTIAGLTSLTSTGLTGSLTASSLQGDIILGTQTSGQYASTIAGGAGLTATTANATDGTAYTIDVNAGAGISLTAPTNDAVNIDTGSVHFTGGVKNKNNTDGVISGSSQVQLGSVTGTTFANANFTFPQDLIIQGNLTARQFIVSSSVAYITTSFSSGSTTFGNDFTDVHQFTGSLRVLGGGITGSINSTNGVISGSSLASATQGVVTLTVNGVAQADTNILNLQTTSRPTFAGITGSINATNGIVSASSLSSTTQGVVTQTINGVATNTNITDLQTTSRPTFSGITASILSTNGVFSGSSQILNSSITNAQLQNSSVTIGNTAVSLGGTATTITGLTSVTSTNFVGTASYVTGSIHTAGNLALSASNASTASFALNGGVTSFNTRTGPVTLAAGDISGLGTGIVSASNVDSASSLSSTTQGVVTYTRNGVATNTNITDLQTTSRPTFAGITASILSTNGVFSGSSQIPNASITNTQLQNSTISGISLGSNLATLTISTGLGGSSYNGSTGVTITNTGVTSFNTRTGAVTLAASDISGLSAGIVSASNVDSASSLSSTTQGVVTYTRNGVATNTNITDLQTTSRPTFAGITASILSTNGVFSGSSQIPAASITNTQLQNSSITIAGTSTALGGTITAATILNGTNVVSASLLTSAVAQGVVSLVTNGVAAQTNILDLQTTSRPTFAGVTASLKGNVDGNAGTATTWATARTITIGSTGKSVDGSGNVSWTLGEIGAAATNQTMYIGTTAVAINRASANLALTGITSIDGNAATVTNGVYTTGDQTIAGNKTFTGNTTIGDSVADTHKITGSLIISSSTTRALALYGSSSASPVFSVFGSLGELFSVTDTFSGDLFSVADISGVPILNVSSSGFTSVNGTFGVGQTTGSVYKFEVTGDAKIILGSLGVNVNPSSTDGRIDASDEITAYSSDERLKTNLRKIENPIEKVGQLEGFIYNWNDLANKLAKYNTTKNYVGVGAQSVQRVLPEAVRLAPFDNDGNDKSLSGENYLTVQYEKIVPLLIEAIKELSERIKVLEEKTK